jgi:hypothetical protein
MMLSRFFGRQNDCTFRRSRLNRRPVVEGLEGRELLSAVALIQGDHIGTNPIQGGHIGTNAV